MVTEKDEKLMVLTLTKVHELPPENKSINFEEYSISRDKRPKRVKLQIRSRLIWNEVKSYYFVKRTFGEGDLIIADTRKKRYLGTHNKFRNKKKKKHVWSTTIPPDELEDYYYIRKLCLSHDKILRIKTGIDYTSPSGDEICGGHRFDVMPLGDSNVTDIWIGDSPLLTRYNRRYRLDQDKDCLIIDRIVNGHSYWNWSRADIGTRNMAYLRDLLMEISQIDLSIGDNTCTWSLADDGIFSVRSSII
ncbi:hypothetical protein Tco_1439581 [Tanacetum coccineum]